MSEPRKSRKISASRDKRSRVATEKTRHDKKGATRPKMAPLMTKSAQCTQKRTNNVQLKT